MQRLNCGLPVGVCRAEGRLPEQMTMSNKSSLPVHSLTLITEQCPQNREEPKPRITLKYTGNGTSTAKLMGI